MEGAACLARLQPVFPAFEKTTTPIRAHVLKNVDLYAGKYMQAPLHDIVNKDSLALASDMQKWEVQSFDEVTPPAL